MNQRIEQINQFLKEDPTDSFLYYALALEYIKENQQGLAIETLLELKEKDPNYTAIYYQLGKLFESKGEVEKASEIYTIGMELTKNDSNKKTFLELKEANNLLLDIDEDDF